MGGVLSCYLMPHPPIMVEEVGKGETKKVVSSVNAAKQVGREISKLAPDSVVVISPHGPVFYDALCIYDFPLKGSLASFGAPGVKLEFKRDDALADEILKRSRQKGIPAVTSREARISKYGFREELDHGVVVPLSLITEFTLDFRLLPIAFGMLTYEKLYAFGRLIRESAEALDRNIVVIASGDLSHRLTSDAPAGYDPAGKEFDEKLLDALKVFDIPALFSMDSSLIERAGECGLRSIWIMAGALDENKVLPRVLSYEGPFGVGYCIASFKPQGSRESLLPKLHQMRKEQNIKRKKAEDPYVSLARYTLENYIEHGKIPKLPEDLPEEMLKMRAGVFVSLKKHGQLRGCIGTFLPTRKNVAEEIQRNAISAGCEDPRFMPVTRKELPDLEYSVDVLTEPEPVSSPDELDPKRYGIIVQKGLRSGLLLPDLEGVNTVEEQLEIALAKAGIRPDENYEILRFRVKRHK